MTAEFTPDEERLMSRDASAKGIMQRALLRLLRVHERNGDLPTNARFLFYELEHLGLVSKDPRPIKPGCKMARRGDQDMHTALTHLRNAGLVPWAWLQDETRRATAFRTAPTVADYVLDAAETASIDRWAGAPAPQIICESRSLAGVLYNVAARYACPVTSTNGQTRGHLINEIAPNLWAGQRVLYLGDWDLCGGHIEEATKRTLVEHAPYWSVSYRETELAATVQDMRQRRRARRYGAAARARTPIESLWERVALTTEQVTELDARRAAEGLGSAVIRKRDDRYNGEDGSRGKYFDAVETEALSQGVIVGMLRDRLDELMPEPLDSVLEREQEQRAEVAERLRRLRD